MLCHRGVEPGEPWVCPHPGLDQPPGRVAGGEEGKRRARVAPIDTMIVPRTGPKSRPPSRGQRQGRNEGKLGQRVATDEHDGRPTRRRHRFWS